MAKTMPDPATPSTSPMLTGEMPRYFSISIQPGAAWRLVDAASDGYQQTAAASSGTCYFTDVELPDEGEAAAPPQFVSDRR